MNRRTLILLVLLIIAICGSLYVSFSAKNVPHAREIHAPAGPQMLVYDASALKRPDCGLQLGAPLHRDVILTIAGDRLRLNEEPSDWAGLQRRLDEIYRTRAEKILFVMNETGEADATQRAAKVAQRVGIQKLCVLDPSNRLKIPLMPGAG
jgi:hypothetical protein